jgi:hypothetical protein
MDGPKSPPLRSRMLVRSCQLNRLRRQLLAQAYQRVCPEIRLSLSNNQIPMSPARSRGHRPLPAHAAAGA